MPDTKKKADRADVMQAVNDVLENYRNVAPGMVADLIRTLDKLGVLPAEAPPPSKKKKE